MNTDANEIFSQLERHLKLNMLRWHVGRVIFCPSCRAVLDYRRAVEIEVTQGANLVKSLVVCASCFDGKVKENTEAMIHRLSSHSLSVEITDGRQLRSGPSAPRRGTKENKPERVPTPTSPVGTAGGVFTNPPEFPHAKTAGFLGVSRGRKPVHKSTV